MWFFLLRKQCEAVESENDRKREKDMAYIIALMILCLAYVICIVCMKYMRNTKCCNLIFMGLVYASYLLLSYTIYRNAGFDDWNFRNTLPTANVSPFMFSMMPVLLCLPQRVRKHIHLLISLLSVGMVASGALGCVYYAAIRYAFHPHFLLDFGAHFLLSLFGIYLVRSGQVEVNRRNCLISGAMIFGVAACMLVHNIVFDTAFFGLSLSGKHNIYNNVLVKSGYLSAVIYFVGLGLILLLGAGYCRLFSSCKKQSGCC